MTTPTENVAIAVLQERMEQQMKTLFIQLGSLQESQKEANSHLIKMDGRLNNVETALSKAQPTLDDYIEVKHKIVGAGKMGTIIWTTLVAAIGALAYSKDYIINWLSK